MKTYDLTPLLRSTIGFDRVSRLLENTMAAGTTDNAYPPYNISKHDEDRYQISMAVAGFTDDDIEVTAKENVLVIRGKIKSADDTTEDVKYLHRGIAQRGFERHFQLAEYIRVDGAHLENGMLQISLVRELPERMKQRNIPITSANGKTLIEKKSKKAKKIKKPRNLFTFAFEMDIEAPTTD